MASESEGPSPANVTSSPSVGKWTRFPKERAAVVHLAHVPPRARLLLAAIFDFADADGLCWPSTKMLAQRAGLDSRRADTSTERRRYVTVDRALKELRAARLMSWTTVEPLTRLPNGMVPRTRMRVLRLDVDAVRKALGMATARRDQIDPFEGIRLIPSPPPLSDVQTAEMAEESGTPEPLNCDLLVKTLNEQQPQEPHPPPREVVVVGSDPVVERVIAAWYARVWHWRFGPDCPALDEERRVRGAVERRLREDHLTETQLYDILEGARVSPFCAGEVNGREVWGAGIFAGCAPRLLALGVAERRKAEAKARASRPLPEARSTPFDPKKAREWAGLVPKTIRDEVIANLEKGSELPSEACGTRS